MNSANWFTPQMQANTEAVEWAIRQVAPERHFAEPPALLGKWPAARHVYHLAHYENNVAVPSIKLWLGGPYPTFSNYNEERDWQAATPEIESFISQFREARAALLELLPLPDPYAWNEARETPWGPRSLYWVMSKTFQHSIEHMNNILRIALLWEHYEARTKKMDESFL